MIPNQILFKRKEYRIDKIFIKKSDFKNKKKFNLTLEILK